MCGVRAQGAASGRAGLHDGSHAGSDARGLSRAARLSRILVIRLGRAGRFRPVLRPVRRDPRASSGGADRAADDAPVPRPRPARAVVRRRAAGSASRAGGICRGSRGCRARCAGSTSCYDLQTSSRSSRYFRLAGRPPWSGIAPGCSHPHANPRRDFMHTRERQREQLEMAGHRGVPPARSVLAYRRRDGLRSAGRLGTAGARRGPAPSRQAVAGRALRGAGAGARRARPHARSCSARRREAPLAGTIAASCRATVDLTGRTALADIAAPRRPRPGRDRQRYRADASRGRHRLSLRGAVLGRRATRT